MYTNLQTSKAFVLKQQCPLSRDWPEFRPRSPPACRPCRNVLYTAEIPHLLFHYFALAFENNIRLRPFKKLYYIGNLAKPNHCRSYYIKNAIDISQSIKTMHVKSALRISSAHNKGGPTDINIAQILHLSNFFELKRTLLYIHLQ